MRDLLFLGLAAFLLLTLLLVVFFLRGMRRMRVMKEETLAQAIPAQATVLDLARGDFSQGSAFRKLELRLRLQVQPSGQASYETTTEWLVDEIALPRVQPLQVVRVRVNRDHPERVYPDETWAEFSDWLLQKR